MKYLCLILVFLSVCFAQEKQATFDLPEQPVYCIGEELATQEQSSIQRMADEDAMMMTSISDWSLADSIRISGIMGHGNRLIFSFNPSADTIESNITLDSLSTICQQAVNYAPTWIQEELISTFWHLGDSAQFYAQLLLNAPANYADEIAFCIAKIGPEVLRNWCFNPQLLLRNVQYLYQIDDSIQYANIIDYGSPPGNYYSTISYCVLDRFDTLWVELPKEIYYYYIVHPTTSDEIPRLDNYVYNKHWREYFFFEADSGFPILKDYIKNAKIVWRRMKQNFPQGRPFTANDCALDIIGNWVTRTNITGATGNRPIHPNVIAHEHNGNCGEIQDLWTAACRTCLIPVVNCSDPCEDHVWNMFYDQAWYPLASDPTSRIADSGVAYEEKYGGTKQVSAIWNWRSDGYWWTVTGTYSDACSLFVYVYDQLGRPMDGARVILSSEGWYGGYSTTAIGFTDRFGRAVFELGDSRNFYASIRTPYGNYPADPNAMIRIINISQTNAKYYKSFYIGSPIPAPRSRQEIFTGDSSIVHRIQVNLNMPSRLEYGYSIARGAGSGDPEDSVRFNRFYNDKQDTGIVDLYITNTVGYNNYVNQNRFGALFLGNDIRPMSLDFNCPDSAKYYAIFSNEDRIYAANKFDLNLKLYVPTFAGITQTNQILQNQNWCAASLNRGKIIIRLNQSKVLSPPEFQLYNVFGSKVTRGFYLQTANDNILTYNVEALAHGIYFLKSANDNLTLTKKVILTR